MEILIDCLKAFVVGGLLCTIGQLFIDYTKLTPARILVAFVVAGVFLGAIGVYDPILEWGGAGASVPLTGFGANLANGVKEAVEKEGLIGILKGGLTASSGGITFAILAAFITALISKPKDKS